MDKLKLYPLIGYFLSVGFIIFILLLVFPNYHVDVTLKILVFIALILTPMIPIVFYFIAIIGKKLLLKPIDEKRLLEFRKLLTEHKSVATIKKRIIKWKKEGYNVEELENMVKLLGKK